MPRRLHYLGRWFSVLSLVLAQGVAYAETPEPAAASLATSLKGDALLDYNAGRVLYRDHDYAGAFVKFQHAYELSHEPRLLWNMAACEKNLRRYAHVLRLVERYEREGGAQLSERERTEASELVRTVRLLVSSLQISVNEPDALIYVDDELVGKSPLPGPVLVDLGERRIKVEKPGFRSEVVPQTVSGASDINMSIVLQPQPHEARLVVSAPGAEAITLDGRPVAQSRFDGRIPSGQHTLRITASGVRPYNAELSLRDGETRTLDITLERETRNLTALWIVGSVVAAAGLGVGGYFLFRPNDITRPTTIGTMPPGQVQLP